MAAFHVNDFYPTSTSNSTIYVSNCTATWTTLQVTQPTVYLTEYRLRVLYLKKEDLKAEPAKKKGFLAGQQVAELDANPKRVILDVRAYAEVPVGTALREFVILDNAAVIQESVKKYNLTTSDVTIWVEQVGQNFAITE